MANRENPVGRGMNPFSARHSQGYRRVVLKLSGEWFGSSSATLDIPRFQMVAEQIKIVRSLGAVCAVVVGGGNIARGSELADRGMAVASADQVGMLATGVNAMALASACSSVGVRAELWTRGPCSDIGKEWLADGSLAGAVDEGVVILAGGMGVPGISTDVSAIYMAAEMEAEAVIASKFGVDGVYDADPRQVTSASKLPTLTATYALEHRLAVMDSSALEFARVASIPIHIVGADNVDSLSLTVKGESMGSRIDPV